MKKIFLMAFMSLALFSCSNDEASEVEKNHTLSLLKMSESSEEDVEAFKLAYSMMKDTEKLSFWDQRLKNSITEENLNSEQTLLVEEVIAEIAESGTDLFSDTPNDTQNAFKTIFVPEFSKRAATAFSARLIEHMFYGYTLIPIGSTAKPCNCNETSMFGCGATDDCKSSTTCEETSSGCGFLLLFECNGKCSFL